MNLKIYISLKFIGHQLSKELKITKTKMKMYKVRL